MKRLAATLIAFLSITAPAHAKKMEHHDLSSLVMLSKHVVLAQRDFWTNGSRSFGYTVTNVYKGSLLSGQRLYVSHSSYDLAGTFGKVPDRKAVLFLREGKDGRLTPVASGIRVLFGGMVYRFEQSENPGPYIPVPQGRDPADVRGARPAPRTRTPTHCRRRRRCR